MRGRRYSANGCHAGMSIAEEKVRGENMASGMSSIIVKSSVGALVAAWQKLKLVIANLYRALGRA